jgi:hypothetical protein
MASSSLRTQLLNRGVLLMILLEFVALGLWSELYRESPLSAPLVEPVMNLAIQVSGLFTGCASLACGPYVLVGVSLYLYALAVILATLSNWILYQEDISLS